MALTKVDLSGFDVSTSANGQFMTSNTTSGYWSNAVYISDTAPTGVALVAGRLWWDSTVGTLKIYYTDTDTSQWVDAVNIVPITNTASYSGNVSVGGTVTVTANAYISANIVGSATFANNISFANTITVTGNATFSNTVAITGNTSLNNTNITGILTTQGIFEKATVNTTPIGGTVNFNYLDGAVQFYNSSSSSNWVVNVRGSASITLDSVLQSNQSASIALAVTQGATAYYPTSFQIDGTTVTPKWQNGTAPSSGDASSVNLYSYAIFKTGAGTYSVFASVSKYA
jgi:hypothetical protein